MDIINGGNITQISKMENGFIFFPEQHNSFLCFLKPKISDLINSWGLEGTDGILEFKVGRLSTGKQIHGEDLFQYGARHDGCFTNNQTKSGPYFIEQTKEKYLIVNSLPGVIQINKEKAILYVTQTEFDQAFEHHLETITEIEMSSEQFKINLERLLEFGREKVLGSIEPKFKFDKTISLYIK